jgi:hypothetical protein
VTFAARVCWGPRAETVEGLAARWSATNRALEALDPPLSGWAALDEDGTVMPLAAEHLMAIVAAGAGDRPSLGFSFGTNDADDRLFFHASAGLSEPVPGLLNLARVEGSALGDVAGLLTALVAAWEPDHGQLSTSGWRHAQRPGPREPWAGAVTYLSAARSRLVPADLAVGARRTPDGGLLLSLVAPDGTLPAAPEVAALGARLREAGAFAPVPTDRPRWTP